MNTVDGLSKALETAQSVARHCDEELSKATAAQALAERAYTRPDDADGWKAILKARERVERCKLAAENAHAQATRLEAEHTEVYQRQALAEFRAAKSAAHVDHYYRAIAPDLTELARIEAEARRAVAAVVARMVAKRAEHRRLIGVAGDLSDKIDAFRPEHPRSTWRLGDAETRAEHPLRLASYALNQVRRRVPLEIEDAERVNRLAGHVNMSDERARAEDQQARSFVSSAVLAADPSPASEPVPSTEDAPVAHGDAE